MRELLKNEVLKPVDEYHSKYCCFVKGPKYVEESKPKKEQAGGQKEGEKKKKIKGRNNINIVILGYNEVGKSAFCIRFVENKYEDFYIPSIGVENYSKIIAYNDRSYKLNFSVIWGEYMEDHIGDE
mgnify:CR=1 FL=1